MLGEAGEDSGDLAGSFAQGEDHFGNALAQGAMVVDFGKAEVLERHVAQSLNGCVGGDSLLSDFVEEFAKSLGVHNRQMSL